MLNPALSIELDISEKLKEQAYRQNFFLAEASARIAAQLIALRKRRGLSQKQVADITGTKQPAISRCEKADYQNWSFNTLRSIADALDARISVAIEPAEDVLGEYSELKSDDKEVATSVGDISRAATTRATIYDYQLAFTSLSNSSFVAQEEPALFGLLLNQGATFSVADKLSACAMVSDIHSMSALKKEIIEKDSRLATLASENERLRKGATPSLNGPAAVREVTPLPLGDQFFSGQPL